MNAKALLLSAALLVAGSAFAAESAHNTDEVLPNSPFKELGMPDAGMFNPYGRPVSYLNYAAPAAYTHYPPMTLIHERPVKPYALVAAPTLPCAPGYCPIRMQRPRPDRN